MVEHLQSADQTMATEDSAWQTIPHFCKIECILRIINPLCAAVEKSRQCGTSSSHGGRENSTEKHQPVSEGISWETTHRKFSYSTSEDS